MLLLLGVFVLGFVLRGAFDFEPARVHMANVVSRLSLARCPAHCLLNVSQPVELVAIVRFRLSRKDRKMHFTSKALVQWMQYMFLSGVTRIVAYDSYSAPWERQYLALKPLIDQGLVTYVDWSQHNPHDVKQEQQRTAYSHAMANAFAKIKNRVFVVTFDIDEYPVVPADSSPGFLLRFIKRAKAKYRGDFGENPLGMIHISNVGFVGPLDRTREMIIDQTHIATKEIVMTGMRSKPVYVNYSSLVGEPLVHHPKIDNQNFLELESNMEAYLAHIWGEKRFNAFKFRHGKPEVGETHVLDSMRDSIMSCKALCSEFYLPSEPFWDRENRKSKSPCWNLRNDGKERPKGCGRLIDFDH